MELFVIYKLTNNEIIGYATNEKDAIKLTNNNRLFEKDPITFTKAEHYECEKLIKSKDDEQCDKFVRIKGFVSEVVFNYNYHYNCSYDLYPDNVKYLKVTNHPELDKDFELKVPKFTKFDIKLGSYDKLYRIKTYFTIWIDDKTVELSLNLKRYLNEIIKTEYVKLDRIKDFKRTFKEVMQVKYSKDYSDDMWKV